MEGVWSKTAAWNWHISAIDAEGPGGDWFDEDGTGAKSSIAQIEAEIEERKITGLVGFDTGGQLAAMLAARASLGLGSERLRFAVICGAALPTRPTELDELLSGLRTTPDATSLLLPTLHCLSEADTVSPPERGRELAECFGPSAEVLWHDRGHAMPSREWWRV